MNHYLIQFRRFQGPRHWGEFKRTQAHSLRRAIDEMVKIADAYFAKHGRTGEFRVLRVRYRPAPDRPTGRESLGQ
jgi:hypothetical protein